jgi:hypothetical protein
VFAIDGTRPSTRREEGHEAALREMTADRGFSEPSFFFRRLIMLTLPFLLTSCIGFMSPGVRIKDEKVCFAPSEDDSRWFRGHIMFYGYDLYTLEGGQKKPVWGYCLKEGMSARGDACFPYGELPEGVSRAAVRDDCLPAEDAPPLQANTPYVVEVFGTEKTRWYYYNSWPAQFCLKEDAGAWFIQRLSNREDANHCPEEDTK